MSLSPMLSVSELIFILACVDSFYNFPIPGCALCVRNPAGDIDHSGSSVFLPNSAAVPTDLTTVDQPANIVQWSRHVQAKRSSLVRLSNRARTELRSWSKEHFLRTKIRRNIHSSRRTSHSKVASALECGCRQTWPVVGDLDATVVELDG